MQFLRKFLIRLRLQIYMKQFSFRLIRWAQETIQLFIKSFSPDVKRENFGIAVDKEHRRYDCERRTSLLMGAAILPLPRGESTMEVSLSLSKPSSCSVSIETDAHDIKATIVVQFVCLCAHWRFRANKEDTSLSRSRSARLCRVKTPSRNGLPSTVLPDNLQLFPRSVSRLTIDVYEAPKTGQVWLATLLRSRGEKLIGRHGHVNVFGFL